MVLSRNFSISSSWDNLGRGLKLEPSVRRNLLSVAGLKIVCILLGVHHMLIYCFLQAVKAVAEAAPLSVVDLEERLLIHICYSPRRCVHRNPHVFNLLSF